MVSIAVCDDDREYINDVERHISQYDIVYWYGEWTAICRHGNTDTPFPFCGARESVPHF